MPASKPAGPWALPGLLLLLLLLLLAVTTSPHSLGLSAVTTGSGGSRRTLKDPPAAASEELLALVAAWSGAGTPPATAPPLALPPLLHSTSALRVKAESSTGTASNALFPRVDEGANSSRGSSRGDEPGGRQGGKQRQGPPRTPIIFIPPLAGVQLQLRLHNKPSAPHWWCWRSTKGWFFAWLNWRLLLPWSVGCLADNLRLECDRRGRCQEPAGVRVRPAPGFDSAMGLMPHPGRDWVTFAPLAAALEQLGWQRGRDMLAHLYDWRLPPTEWVSRGGYFDQLQQQVEAAVEETGRPAVAISLSMGSPYLELFLRRHVTPAWQQRYMAGHVAISGAWAGSLLAQLGMVTASQEVVRSLLRAIPALSWIAPAPAVFPDQVLVRDELTGQEYTAATLGDWLKLRGATQAAQVWSANRQWMEDGGPPANVTLYCLYGTGLPTVAGVTFPAPGPGQAYDLQYSDGDGTVPLRSLQVCDSWQQRASQQCAGSASSSDQSSSQTSNTHSGAHSSTHLSRGSGAQSSSHSSSQSQSSSRAEGPEVLKGPCSTTGPHWQRQRAPVHVWRYPGIQHGTLLRDAHAALDIIRAVMELNHVMQQ